LSNKLYLSVGLVDFFSAVFSLLISHYFSVLISQPCKSDGLGLAKLLPTFNRDCIETKFIHKTLFRIPNICSHLVSSINIFYFLLKPVLQMSLLQILVEFSFQTFCYYKFTNYTAVTRSLRHRLWKCRYVCWRWVWYWSILLWF